MKNDTPNHYKMDRLATILDIHHLLAVGIMERIWHWTADFAQQGNIGKATNAEIAAGIRWDMDPDALINGLVEAEWLDLSEPHRLLVHDWPQHCEKSVHYYLAYHRLTFADGTAPDLSKFNRADRPAIATDYREGRTGGKRKIDVKNPPCPDLWKEFWRHYPWKRNVEQALPAWCRVVTSDTVAYEILKGQQLHLQPGGNLAAEDKQWIPYATNWLKNRRWTDPYEPVTRKGKPEDTPFEARNPTDDDLAVGMGDNP